MLRVLPRVCWLWLAASAVAAGGTFHIGAHNFTLPNGFEIELVAGPPLVDRPVSAAFDEEGRLYVTESSGSSAKAPEQAKDQPNRVIRFEAADATGHFTKRTVFADQLPLVEGVMWLNGSLYVGAPPSIWKLTDTDGDGVADQRSEWYQGKTVTGCGNDIHGPFLGPEGWIYWCKGAFAEQTHEIQGGRTIKDRASHIFRCRPDGTGLESIMTGGMDNPVGLAFTREGEPIFSATFLDLSGNGKRDGLGHAVYGGVFGKENAVVEDRAVIRTGPLLPAMTHYGAGAPCGMTRIQAGVLGEAYRDNLLVCLFNLHKVTRHVLEPMGATYKTRDSDFVVSDNLDFHPTDVIEDADGSLLIVDTGGWYKVCCPTSQLAKPDLLGAIYRVRKTGAPKPADPRGLNLDWAKLDVPTLAALLGNERPAVIARATAWLAEIGATAVPALASAFPSASLRTQQSILWTLAQIPTPAARDAVHQAMDEPPGRVRQTAAKIAGLTRDAKARDELVSLLPTDSLHMRRVAAEGLGRLGDASAVPALIAAAGQTSQEPFLTHAVIQALIEIAQPEPTREGLARTRGGEERRAAVIALSEMSQTALPAAIALELIQPHQTEPPSADTALAESLNRRLREAVMWSAARHPEWAPELANFFRRALEINAEDSRGQRNPGIYPVSLGRRRQEIERLFGSLLREPALQPIATAMLREGDREEQVSALRAIRQAELKTMPGEWIEQIETLLRTKPELIRAAVPAANLAVVTKEGARLVPALLEVAHSAAAPELRLDALSALPAGSWTPDEVAFAQLRERFTATANSTPESRATAATVLARATLTDPQRAMLTELFPQLGLMELTRLLPAFNRALPEPMAAQFLAALEKSPALASCPPQALREIFGKQPAALQPQCQALLARLNMDTAQQRAKLDAIAAELPPGEVRRGQLIFNGKAACTVCHSFGYLGGKFGPDLTSIGNVRSERDLLEAIVFPSASFVRSFEPMTVKLKNGTELIGLLRSENDETVVLATAPGAEQRLARGEVASITPGATSLMPQGFDQILTRQELSDLIAFLKASQPKPH